MTTTFRADVVQAAVDSLDVFIAANPDKLRRSELARPPSVAGDLPLAFIDGRAERIHWMSQLMNRVMSLEIVIVSPLYDNVETVRRHDVLIDLLIDHLNVNSIHFVDDSDWVDMTIGDEDYPVTSGDGDVRHFYATRITLVVSKSEGRA